MGRYIVTAGQNIYDVSLHIYGSVEGILDLLMCNPELSLATHLKPGSQLSFSDNFIIDSSTVAYNKKNGIVPANGERGVYYKSPSYPPAIELFISSGETSAEPGLSGSGKIEIDWGDNSPLQPVRLEQSMQNLRHFFDNKAGNSRRIRIYGDFSIRQADFGLLDIKSLFFLKPVSTESLILRKCPSSLSFLPLCRDIHSVGLTGGSCENLLPLVECKNLIWLDLSKMKLSQNTLDSYLAALAHNNLGRRSCHITLAGMPSGNYAEPKRDDNLEYIITSGMEAVWVITNEPAWNEAGYWKFTINNKTYTSQP